MYRNKKESSENICLVHTALLVRGLDGEQRDGTETGGNGDVVLERDDESGVDGEKEQCECFGDYRGKKRVVGYRKKEADDVFGPRDQSRWPGKSGYHGQNRWQSKSRKASSEVFGPDEGIYWRRSDNAATAGYCKESRAVEVHKRQRLQRHATSVR